MGGIMGALVSLEEDFLEGVRAMLGVTRLTELKRRNNKTGSIQEVIFHHRRCLKKFKNNNFWRRCEMV